MEPAIVLPCQVQSISPILHGARGSGGPQRVQYTRQGSLRTGRPSLGDPVTWPAREQLAQARLTISQQL